MGASKDTPHIRLSQFQDNGIDKPSWLADYNGDMLKIDTAIEAQRVNNETTSNLATTAMTLVGEAKTKAEAATVAADAATTKSEAATVAADAATTASGAATTTANTAKTDAASAKAAASSASTSAGLALQTAREAMPNFRRATVAVFVGTSNVTAANTNWPDALSTRMGWDCRNYAVSGMGYSFGGANSFEGQLNRAKNDGAFNNADVGFVFICDGANDARSKLPTFESAKIVYALALATFPNARIIVLPMLTSPHATDRAVDVVFWQRATIDDLREASTSYAGIEWIDGSWSWHQDPGYMNETVHYNTTGYNRIRILIEQYLRGADTWIDSAWVSPTVSAGFTNPQSGSTQPCKAKRVRDDIQLIGSFKPTTNVPIQSVPLIFPAEVWPYADTSITAWQNGVPLNATYGANGNLTMWTATSSNALVNIAAVIPHV